MSPKVIMLVGLSGAGKTTLAKMLVESLTSRGADAVLLDGDQIRAAQSRGGFKRADRLAHLTLVAQEAARLETEGKVVVGAFIAPYEEARKILRSHCKNYKEVWIDTPLEVCEERDVKGLYARARRGEIQNFTGISDDFEIPSTADVRLQTLGKTAEESLAELQKKLAL